MCVSQLITLIFTLFLRKHVSVCTPQQYYSSSICGRLTNKHHYTVSRERILLMLTRPALSTNSSAKQQPIIVNKYCWLGHDRNRDDANESMFIGLFIPQKTYILVLQMVYVSALSKMNHAIDIKNGQNSVVTSLPHISNLFDIAPVFQA